AVPDVAFNAYG
nr:RecName: Full=Big defensin; Short=RPD-1 [Ruditapes philippinarum]